MEFLKHILSPAYRRNERVMGKFASRRIHTGERATLKTYEPFQGGNMTYRDAVIVEKRPYGLVVGNATFISSNRRFYDIAQERSRETTGMQVTKGNVFVPFRKMTAPPKKSN